ncbi:hypothetical protein FIBSPDRAFT_56569 [Athelia psychrophila]|uniref:Uncharacterized protein n=1 Tax=Athelia psychrophila TaxID=1759441 RepID=A0A166FAY5_9AGAM|nr:hypothetical protein FIBSPDRAFT_56569 [Fibularhizoctonia sp. CBS 109695]
MTTSCFMSGNSIISLIIGAVVDPAANRVAVAMPECRLGRIERWLGAQHMESLLVTLNVKSFIGQRAARNGRAW